MIANDMTSRNCARSLSSFLLFAISNIAWSAEPTAEQIEFFENKIRPVLVKHCYECHSQKIASPRGGLRLDDRDAVMKGGDSGPSVVAGEPGKSPLIQALRYDGLEMPPKGKLPPSVIADFEIWVKQGAPDPRIAMANMPSAEATAKQSQALKHWAFQRPAAVQPPAVKNSKWPINEIDRFVMAKLEEQGLQPAPAADRRTLIRRAYMDLIGLPPEPEKVQAFVNDPASDSTAFAAVVEELLRSPHYGERWARYWLDIARYAEDQAHTFKARRYPQGYLYRDWVVNSFNNDLPYDRFLSQQIAGDLMEDTTPKHERLAALGLFAMGPVYYQDNGEKDKAMADEWDDRVDTLIRGTQAMTISCARCHDHKFDPLSMSDYYGLIGIFASSQYQERPAVADDVVKSKEAAEAAVKSQQLEIDQFLATEARNVRERLVPEIPQYVTAAWKILQLRKDKNEGKKKADQMIAAQAKSAKVNEELLKRWVAYLDEKPGSGAVKGTRPYLESWRKLKAAEADGVDLTKDSAALAAVSAFASEFEKQAQAILPLRTAIAEKFGEDAAFVSQADRVTVAPGVIPIGNLFDDAKGTRLQSAVASDPFKSTASENSLGVVRVAQGWGRQTKIAPGITFDFTTVGSDERKHGAVVNDGWDTSGGIRTLGQKGAGNLPRTEQGIGMHANALLTIDLDEIRRAGLIPSDKKLKLVVDRAGMNDDVFGGGASAHVAVIVSQTPKAGSEFDAVLFASLNGQTPKVEENDGAYYFAGQLPDPIRGDGKFFSIDVTLPLEARYVTFVAAAAAKPGEENSISADHVVFSGARIEFDPATDSLASTDPAKKADAKPTTQEPLVEWQGLLHSELFSDKGLLAIANADVAKYLVDEAAKKLAELNAERDRRKKVADSISVVMAHSLTEGQGVDMPVYLAGDPKKKGPIAPRAYPAALAGGERHEFKPKGSGRMELAAAITSPENPLTARVWVNRIWAGHFGTGLVRTPSNFGTLGERPSHPELLDWLAMNFMKSGWSMKALHRQIMMSATYRQSSSPLPASLEKLRTTDPDNRLLSYMPRRRLEVEPWRDALLAVAGNLDRAMGGPSVNLAGGNNRRRTLYGFISRHQLDELLRLFDFPDPNITAGQRTVTTVPLQQLFVLNSDFMVTQAKSLVARLSRESESDEGRIDRAFQLLFGRSPSSAELQLGLQFVTETAEATKLNAWEQYALALLGSNEFLFVD